MQGLFQKSLLYKIVYCGAEIPKCEFTIMSNAVIDKDGLAIAMIEDEKLLLFGTDLDTHKRFCEVFQILPFSYYHYFMGKYNIRELNPNNYTCANRYNALSEIQILSQYRLYINREYKIYNYICTHAYKPKKSCIDYTCFSDFMYNELYDHEIIAICNENKDPIEMLNRLKLTSNVKIVIIYSATSYSIKDIETKNINNYEGNWEEFVRDYYFADEFNTASRFMRTKAARN